MPLFSLVAAVAFAAAAAPPAPAVQAPVKLAIPTLTALNMSEKEVAYFTDHLAARLSVEGLEVITAAQIATLIGFERQKQMAGCSEESCMAELVDALGADAVITGSLGRFGQRFQVNVKAVRANNAKPLSVYTAEARGEAALLERFNEAAGVLAHGVLGAFGRKRATAAVVGQGGSLRSLTWIPATAAGASVIAGGVFLVLARGDYDALVEADPTVVNDADARALRDRGNLYQWVGIGGLALGAAAGATAVAFWLSPDAPRVAWSQPRKG